MGGSDDSDDSDDSSSDSDSSVSSSDDSDDSNTEVAVAAGSMITLTSSHGSHAYSARMGGRLGSSVTGVTNSHTGIGSSIIKNEEGYGVGPEDEEESTIMGSVIQGSMVSAFKRPDPSVINSNAAMSLLLNQPGSATASQIAMQQSQRLDLQ